jgi:hypothetical protein
VGIISWTLWALAKHFALIIVDHTLSGIGTHRTRLGKRMADAKRKTLTTAECLQNNMY